MSRLPEAIIIGGVLYLLYKKMTMLKHLILDGTDSYIEVPSSPQLSVPTTGALTIAIQIRPDTLNFPVTEGSGTNIYIQYMGRGNLLATDFEWSFRMYNKESYRPNRMSCYVFNKEGGIGTGSYVQDYINAGHWIWMICKFNLADGKVSIYKDGHLRDCDVFMRGLSPPGNCNVYTFDVSTEARNAPLRIGTFTKSSYFLGAIKELVIFGKPLTDTEILDFVNDTNTKNPITRQGAVLWHRYYRGDAIDYSGNGHHGIIKGNARFEPDAPIQINDIPYVEVFTGNYNGSSPPADWNWSIPSSSLPNAVDFVMANNSMNLNITKQYESLDIFSLPYFTYGTFTIGCKFPNEDVNLTGTVFVRNVSSGGAIMVTYYNYTPNSLEFRILNGYDITGANIKVFTTVIPVMNIGQGFHTIDIVWLKDSVTLKVDNVSLYTYVGPNIPDVPLQLRLRCENPIIKGGIINPGKLTINKFEYNQA